MAVYICVCLSQTLWSTMYRPWQKIVNLTIQMILCVIWTHTGSSKQYFNVQASNLEMMEYNTIDIGKMDNFYTLNCVYYKNA